MATAAVRSRPRIAFAGISAAFAVGIGYMDPGNWATDLNATRYGYALLWAILGSGIAAIGVQMLVLRFTSRANCDLMEAISRRWPSTAKRAWYIYALAIIATELAEFVGLVVGLQLLTGSSVAVSLALAVGIFALLLLTGCTRRRGFELLAILTTAFLGFAYAIDVTVLHPGLGPIVRGIVLPTLPGPGALLAVVGIVGATIMPHNLFLHSGLALDKLRDSTSRSRAFRSSIVATAIALGIATVINGAILIVGVSTLTSTIETAYRALQPLAGPSVKLLFGLGLIVAALSATASGACAGDIICHDAAPIRLSLLQRRVIAITPAVILLAAGMNATALLLVSQVVLGLVLPAVIVPLLALVIHLPQERTRLDFALLGCTSLVLIAIVACDGLVLQTLVPHS